MHYARSRNSVTPEVIPSAGRGVYENRSLHSRGFDFLPLPNTSSRPRSLEQQTPTVSLRVPSGAPLRLYLTQLVSKRIDAPVEAKLLEPVFAFDREVIPAGTVAIGKVNQAQPVGKWQRMQAILNGDFTPLRRGEVEFTTLKLPDGSEIATHTAKSMALNSIYIEPSPKKKKDQKATAQNPNGGILGTCETEC
jgi:hypothetical protein